MKHLLPHATGLVLLALVIWSTPAVADSMFTIEDPPIDFEVVDAEPWDGYGDNGPYDTFNDALLGTLGECRSMAEFDISSFSVPPGEVISSATFGVRITDVDIFGLGVDGENPESLAADGYIGNGVQELSDFEAGDGNVLDSVGTPHPEIGQVVIFDVTSHIISLVDAEEQYVGLTVRAESFGGLMMQEGGTYPILRITTSAAYSLGDLNCDGSMNGLDIDPFVVALTSTPADYPEYYAQYPDCDANLADCNADGSINGLDIDGFVDLLVGS